MGCDIHMFVEKRIKGDQSYHPYWSKMGKVFKNTYFRSRQPIDDYNEINSDQPYKGRNYTLFAFLADVRNYHELKPLAQPKGVPIDASDDYKKIVEDWGSDGHSHSYFTLKELEEVDWDFTTVKQAGLVDPKNYELFKKTNRPNEWCQGTTSSEYTRIEWETSLREFLTGFMDTIGELNSILWEDNRENKAGWGKLTSEDIRIVFFFDN